MKLQNVGTHKFRMAGSQEARSRPQETRMERVSLEKIRTDLGRGNSEFLERFVMRGRKDNLFWKETERQGGNGNSQTVEVRMWRTGLIRNI